MKRDNLMTRRRAVTRLGATSLMLLGVQGAGAQERKMVDLCAEFAIFPDNHKLGQSFTLAGFNFKQLGGTLMMFVNDTAGERGLQFPKEGIEITLPIPLPNVMLRLGTFAGPVKIVALNSSGKEIHKQEVPGLNKYIDLKIPPSLTREKTASLRLTGGGNEGLIPRICVEISVC